jgi:hypothetical protein
MTNEERLDYLIGQVAAIQAFCAASLVAHPRPSAVLVAFESASEVTIAKTIPTAASDAMIQGVESMCDRLIKSIQLEVARQRNNNV